MKQKLNYTVEVSSKLTTLFFFHSQNQRAKAGLMAVQTTKHWLDRRLDQRLNGRLDTVPEVEFSPFREFAVVK